MFLFLAAAIPQPALATNAAFVPYESYNYSFWYNPDRSPAPYRPTTVWNGRLLGAGDFREPRDLFVTDDAIYVADTGNKRIVKLSADGKLERIFDTFEWNGAKETFQTPTGIYVREDGDIYVADRDRGQIIILGQYGRRTRVIENPQADFLPANFVFQPLKVAVDHAGRVFVVAQGVYEGIMEFSEDGQFLSYVGTNRVRPNLADYIWRLISTQAQREQMVLFVPTEFTNLDIDERNFIYATNLDTLSETPIKRINAYGKDILKRNGYVPVAGDVRGTGAGRTEFIDIAVMPDGKYSALDGLRGRIFTYDDEGNLLYIFGNIGNQAGTFRTPVALAARGDELFVLDRQRGSITVFVPTAFGSRVNTANHYHYNGMMEEADAAWREVLKLNANYELAYKGIGRSLMRQGRLKESLEMLKLGQDHEYYGIAYKRYRRELLKSHYETVLTVLVVALAAFVVFRIFLRKIQQRRGDLHAAGQADNAV